MRPLARIDWLLAVAGDKALPPSALAVAVAIAKHVNIATGDARPAKATLAELVGTDERAVRRMVQAMESAGWLRVTRTAGRACCTYAPANPGTATRVQPGQDNPGSNANPGTATRVPVVANPGEAMPPTRAPSPPEQGMNRDEQDNGDNNCGFAVRDGGEWRLPDDLRATLADAFPDRDLDAELAKARAWCACNPAGRKTARGMPRFLNSWLGRAKPSESPPPDGIPRPGADALAYAAEIEREIAAKDPAHV